MIEFMLISAPRSASTWAANWLTTDTTLCLHDPLWKHHYSALDEIKSDKTIGIACTGIALFTDWVNAHPARKVILHRDLSDVDASLVNIGLTKCGKQWKGVLGKIRGVHMDWRDLFDKPGPIYEYLLDKPFDEERHRELVEMNVQPSFSKLSIDRAATSRLIRELEYARQH